MRRLYALRPTRSFTQRVQAITQHQPRSAGILDDLREISRLKFVAGLFRVRELAERVAKKLQTAVTGFIYQQVWRGVNVERWADTAAEAGEHKGKYFTWLCR